MPPPSQDLMRRLARLQRDDLYLDDPVAQEPEWSEAEERERLIQDFNRKNPKLSRQLKRAVKTKDVGFLLKQLLRGTFWGAATISNPDLIGGSLFLNQLIKRNKRQKALKQYLQAHGLESDIEEA